jgi:RNA polymerase sigma-70 factor (ECF subfamily)
MQPSACFVNNLAAAPPGVLTAADSFLAIEPATASIEEHESDEELLQRHLQGSRDAFGVLVQRHRRTCMQLAVTVLRNPASAEDAVQAAVLRAYCAAHTYRGEAPFDSWLRMIVLNSCRMALRAAKVRRTESGDSAVHMARCSRPSPERAFGADQVRRLVRQEIHRLPQVLSGALLATVVHGSSLREYADRIGSTEAAVKSRLSRGRKLLKARLEQRIGLQDWRCLLR